MDREANLLEIQGLRKLVGHYFKIVRKRIGEMVQKALVTVLAIGIDDDIHQALRNGLTVLSAEERDEIYSEPEHVATLRQELVHKSEVFKQTIADIWKLERQLKLQ